GDLLPVAGDAMRMEPSVDGFREQPSLLRISMDLSPIPGELLVLPVAALGARAVAGCVGCRFVEKEELGIGPRAHDRSLAAAEREGGGNPVLMPVGVDDPLFIIVQDAPVAHQLTAGGGGMELAKGIDAVLVGHQRPFIIQGDSSPDTSP